VAGLAHVRHKTEGLFTVSDHVQFMREAMLCQGLLHQQYVTVIVLSQ
jgi:hypothetical protein